jgi:hypothetical protein
MRFWKSNRTETFFEQEAAPFPTLVASAHYAAQDAAMEAYSGVRAPRRGSCKSPRAREIRHDSVGRMAISGATVVP